MGTVAGCQPDAQCDSITVTLLLMTFVIGQTLLCMLCTMKLWVSNFSPSEIHECGAVCIAAVLLAASLLAVLGLQHFC
jgi:hypothetical protein